MTRTDDIGQRLARLERIVAAAEAERLGVSSGTGPMDPAWRIARQRARADLQAIIAEQAEAPLETRGTTA